MILFHICAGMGSAGVGGWWMVGGEWWVVVVVAVVAVVVAMVVVVAVVVGMLLQWLTPLLTMAGREPFRGQNDPKALYEGVASG